MLMNEPYLLTVPAAERLPGRWPQYPTRWRDRAVVRLLNDGRHAPSEYYDGLTVGKTFALAIEEAGKLNPAAEPFIVHAALLAPEAIPLFLFSEARGTLGGPLAEALAGDGLDEVVAALRKFGLIDRESMSVGRDLSTTTDVIRLHRLMNPAQAMLSDIELTGVVADDDGVGQEAMRLDAAPQGALGRDQDWIGIDLERRDAEPFEMRGPGFNRSCTTKLA
jgi:hypothetical protein